MSGDIHCLIWGLDVLQSNMVSPFAMHQQQLTMLAQQQSLLMAAAAKSGGDPKFSSSFQLPVSNGTNLPSNFGNQIPGMMMPGAGPADLQKLMQVESIITPASINISF